MGTAAASCTTSRRGERVGGGLLGGSDVCGGFCSMCSVSMSEADGWHGGGCSFLHVVTLGGTGEWGAVVWAARVK